MLESLKEYIDKVELELGTRISELTEEQQSELESYVYGMKQITDKIDTGDYNDADDTHLSRGEV